MNVIPKHLEATTAKLVEIGCEVEEFDDAVRVVSKGRLKHTQVKTLPYPGFPNRYAAADGRDIGIMFRDKYDYRKHF